MVALSRVIQGVPESIDYFLRGNRGTPDEQKIIWEGEVFVTNFTKKILKDQGCVLEQFFVLQSCSQLNKLSNSVHNTSV